MEEHWARKSSRKLKQKPCRQARCLQSCSQAYAQLAFLYKPGLPYEGMVLPTAGTVLLHQPPIKTVSRRHACRPALSETPLSGGQLTKHRHSADLERLRQRSPLFVTCPSPSIKALASRWHDLLTLFAEPSWQCHCLFSFSDVCLSVLTWLARGFFLWSDI